MESDTLSDRVITSLQLGVSRTNRDVCKQNRQRVFLCLLPV